VNTFDFLTCTGQTLFGFGFKISKLELALVG